MPAKKNPAKKKTVAKKTRVVRKPKVKEETPCEETKWPIVKWGHSKAKCSPKVKTFLEYLERHLENTNFREKYIRIDFDHLSMKIDTSLFEFSTDANNCVIFRRRDDKQFDVILPLEDMRFVMKGILE